MRTRCAVLALALLAVAADGARGQELPTTPTNERIRSFLPPEEESSGQKTVIDLSSLTGAFVTGNWTDVIKFSTALLGKVQAGCVGCFDLKRDYVHLVWTGTLPGAGEPTTLSVVVHDPADSPYSRVLPGLSGKIDRATRKKAERTDAKFVEVFLSDNPKATIASYYITKPLPDPLLAQVPSVVDKFVGPLFALFDRISPHDMRVLVSGAPLPEKPKIKAIVRDVTLPEARAGVEVTFRVVQPITRPQFTERLADLESKLGTHGFAIERAIVVGAIVTGLKDVPDHVEACNSDTEPDPGLCRQTMFEVVRTAVNQERPKVLTDAGRRDLDRIETLARDFIEGLKPTVVAGKASLDNSPLTHLSFGLLSSIMLHSYGNDPRVKVEGGKVVAAPLPRALQMVVLNVSPRGYQGRSTRRWDAASAVQPFVGVAFAPDIGLAAGLSFKVLANIGVNIGYAHLFITQPTTGLTLGSVLDEKVKDEAGRDTDVFRYAAELRRDPLGRGRRGALFAGVSYNFK